MGVEMRGVHGVANVLSMTGFRLLSPLLVIPATPSTLTLITFDELFLRLMRIGRPQGIAPTMVGLRKRVHDWFLLISFDVHRYGFGCVVA